MSLFEDAVNDILKEVDESQKKQAEELASEVEKAESVSDHVDPSSFNTELGFGIYKVAQELRNITKETRVSYDDLARFQEVYFK